MSGNAQIVRALALHDDEGDGIVALVQEVLVRLSS